MIRTALALSILSLATAAWAETPEPATPPATKVDKAHYAVTVTAPTGGPAEIALAPKAGFKFNKAYPTKVTLTAGAGVTLPKATLKKGDAKRLDDSGAAFSVDYACGGDSEVTADLKFSVCNDETCEMVKEKVAWKVTKAP